MGVYEVLGSVQEGRRLDPGPQVGGTLGLGWTAFPGTLSGRTTGEDYVGQDLPTPDDPGATEISESRVEGMESWGRRTG